MPPSWTRRAFLSLLAWPGAGPWLFSGRKIPRPLGSRLGIITDELTDDLEPALNFLAAYSLHYCELRQLWHKNILTLSRQELARAKRLIETHPLRVSNIASPIFKYDLPGMPGREQKRDTFLFNATDRDTEDLLRRSFEIAHFLGTSQVRIFSYWRVEDPEKAYPHVRDRLAKAAELAGRNGILLLLENEHTCNVGTGKELGRLLREVNSPHLRGNWDPGNAVVLDEVPYPDGYREVRGLFSHMHIKDIIKDRRTQTLTWVPVGRGQIDVRGQFRALREDLYDGTLSLETAYRRAGGNALESTREALEGLIRILKEVNEWEFSPAKR